MDMAAIVNILFNPITLVVIGFIVILGVMTSSYEIKFDENDEEIEF